MADKQAAGGRLAFAWFFALMMLALGGVLAYLGLRGVPIGSLVFVIVGAVSCGVVGLLLSFSAMKRRAGAAGSHALFDTIFPMMMSMVPVAGPFIALLSVRKLLFLDRLNAATITTTSGASRSTSHYDRLKLHGSGRPAGLVLLILALVQPALALATFADLRGKLGFEPITLSWDGRPLHCRGTERYEAKGLVLEPLPGAHTLLRIEGRCQVRLRGCTMKGADQPLRIRASKQGMLLLDGCKLAGEIEIRANDEAAIELRSTSVESAKGYVLRLGDRALATIRDSEVKTAKRYALRVDKRAEARLSKTTLGGAVYISGHGKLSMRGGEIRGGAAHQAVYIYGKGPRLSLDGVKVTGRDGVSVGRDASVAIKGGLLQTSSLGLRASSQNAKVTIDGATIAAPTALRASSGGLISVSSSKVFGDVRAYGRGKIVLIKTPVKGRVRQSSSGVIKQLSGGSASTAAADVKTLERRREELVKLYRKQACKGLMSCWDDYEGIIKGSVEMRIGADGKVSKVSERLSRGMPAKVASCVRAAAAQKRIQPFYGPVGRLRCSFSGSAVSGSKMIRTTTAYEPDEGAEVFSEAAK